MSKMVLALYDCRSKQEYIYRTNKVKEIMGASKILTDLFKDFFTDTNKNFKFNTNWEKTEAPENYLAEFEKSGNDGEIVYEGGGNLCMIYKDKETYIAVNRELSKKVIRETFGVSIIASFTEVTDNFVEDRKKLYIENALQKNLGSYHTPCNVLPFTQVDRLTYQPVVKKDKQNETMHTTESQRKLEKYEEKRNTDSIIETEFDKIVDKGEESLLAIIYIDGNNMGKKVKDSTANVTTYTEGVNALRNLSKRTNEVFVEKPIKAVKELLKKKYEEAEEKEKLADNKAEKDKYNKEKKRYLFRPIIFGGDEINIVCNARAVPEIIETYFKSLEESNKEGEKNSSCAGIAIFHSHDPFADVYRIAEQCCESGKKKSHEKPEEELNYIDFHFCHGGITNELDVIRKTQEEKYTERPYEYSSTWKKFMEYGEKLSGHKRSDVKALGEAVFKGNSYYDFEIERIKSRDKNNNLAEIYGNSANAKKYLFDISIVYDLWFANQKDGD